MQSVVSLCNFGTGNLPKLFKQKKKITSQVSVILLRCHNQLLLILTRGYAPQLICMLSPITNDYVAGAIGPKF